MGQGTGTGSDALQAPGGRLEASDGRPEPSHDQLETLYAQACTRLLAATDFGRLAVVADGRPRLVVLNHVMDGDDLLFRTTQDSLIARLTADGAQVPAAFEVDSAFPVGRSGWSVIANGTLARESDPARQAAALERITTWAQGERETLLRLVVQELTGRRVGRL